MIRLKRFENKEEQDEYIFVTSTQWVKHHKDVSDFLKSIFHSDIISFDVELDQLDYYSEKLTKENFKEFLMYKDANKFNL